MRYQFQTNSKNFSMKSKIFTDVIKVLVSVNFIIFILQTISSKERLFFSLFGLVPNSMISELTLWQPVSYLFFHGSVWHVLINMFVLWMFGSELEQSWGKVKFLKYYFYTGVGAGIITFLFNISSTTPVVGASGAVYGVLLAYGITYPNRTIYLYGLIPIKSIWFVVAIGFLAFFSSFQETSQISHLTHISGMLIGFILLKNKFNFSNIRFKIRKRVLESEINKKEIEISKITNTQKEIDQILEKIQEVGFDHISENDTKRLYKASKTLSRRKYKD